MLVGERIRTLREHIGYSQNKLAEWAGISQTRLRRVELGEADITVGHLQLICDALGISLCDFFSDAPPEEDPLSFLSPKQRALLGEFCKSLKDR